MTKITTSITTRFSALTRRHQFLALGIAAVVLVALSVTATVAIVTVASQKPTVPSDAALYVFDTDILLANDDRVWAWSDDANGSMSESNPEAKIVCPAESTNSASFLSLQGGERDPSLWAAWENLGYGADTFSVLLPPLTPDRMGQGAGQAVKTNGGTFSLGVACTTNNGLAVTAAYYRTIKVDAGGNWRLEPLKN
jgi:hypothetical protein